MKRVHYILDEASAILPMDCVNDALDKGRAFGIFLQLYFQSQGQLKHCFPEDEGQTLLSNVIKVSFGTNDYSTAEMISNSCGESTIILKSGGQTEGESTNSGPGGGSTGHSWSVSDNWSQQGRKLLKPEEILAMPQRNAITLVPGMPPIMTRLLRYYEEPNLGPSQPRTFRDKAMMVKECLSYFVVSISIAVLLTIGLIKQQSQAWPSVRPYGEGVSFPGVFEDGTGNWSNGSPLRGR